jgi:hypothetical protein
MYVEAYLQDWGIGLPTNGLVSLVPKNQHTGSVGQMHVQERSMINLGAKNKRKEKGKRILGNTTVTLLLTRGKWGTKMRE